MSDRKLLAVRKRTDEEELDGEDDDDDTRKKKTEAMAIPTSTNRIRCSPKRYRMALQDATLEAHFLVIRLEDDAPEGEWYGASSSCPAPL